MLTVTTNVPAAVNAKTYEEVAEVVPLVIDIYFLTTSDEVYIYDKIYEPCVVRLNDKEERQDINYHGTGLRYIRTEDGVVHICYVASKRLQCTTIHVLAAEVHVQLRQLEVN